MAKVKAGKDIADQVMLLREEVEAAAQPENAPVRLLLREEKFAQGVAKGLTQTAAALEAGYAEASAHVQGSRLMKKAKVRARILQLSGATGKDVEDARKDHLTQLVELRQMAKAKGQLSAAIKAEELRGRVLGLYVEQVIKAEVGGQLSVEDANPAEIKQAIHDAIQRLGLLKDANTIDAEVTSRSDKVRSH